MSPSGRPAVGDLYQRELLESRATYRVVAVEDEHVQVEAVDVPGLPAGHRMRLTTASLDDMTCIAADPAPEPADATAQRVSAPRTFPRPA